jgi:hypothetical protein
MRLGCTVRSPSTGFSTDIANGEEICRARPVHGAAIRAPQTALQGRFHISVYLSYHFKHWHNYNHFYVAVFDTICMKCYNFSSFGFKINMNKNSVKYLQAINFVQSSDIKNLGYATTERCCCILRRVTTFLMERNVIVPSFCFGHVDYGKSSDWEYY